MRQFSASYLEHTRRGMWADSRDALADLDLRSRQRVLDVGCGTGELTRVLREAVPGTVLGCDADRDLVDGNNMEPGLRDRIVATLEDGVVDLAVCQALLINLPDPAAAVAAFRRVSSDLVAAVEPNNAAVTVDSTVESEPALARRARRLFLDGVETDVTLGADAAALFEDAGLTDVRTRRYDHERTVEPPYSEAELNDAGEKVSGDGLDRSKATILAGETSEAEFDALRNDWKAMGRAVVEQMQDGDYRRTETVPFYVTVGRVP
ncbi:methyltransferase domain-containing protein [Halapricum sp. CBA1109]|uniref:class I SAM-dependent methyltransferase n=1 Tax=Halapricum sp. CBA1109 TaxID=2668068 RepID=UPI0012FC3475|nr:class I SAM-dependent methyltransferase [Halapricum sp. CBA1109]MUV90319.1 methyltransferase domain-containing protein [Halapricum sp. CBA1109]